MGAMQSEMHMTRVNAVHAPYLAGWRATKGLTQDGLAEQSGVARTTIARAETGGALNLTTAVKLAKALGVTVYDLRSTDPERL
jgi:DNA-binding XRE family transcriptional regulator